MKALELLAEARAAIMTDEYQAGDDYAYLATLAIDVSVALLEQEEGMGKWHVRDAFRKLMRETVKVDETLVF